MQWLKDWHPLGGRNGNYTATFTEILRFELVYRLRRWDTWLFFLFFFLTTAIAFATGDVIPSSQAYINSPFRIADVFAGMSSIMTLVSGVIMSGSLYRDIEFNTHGSYLTLPITRVGYFWGRFLGSFLVIAFIGTSPVWGSLAGTWVGSHIGLIHAASVGPYRAINYWQPYLGFVLPNLFLTSALFFGLVAYTRNARVIYAAGVLFFFGYVLSAYVLRDVPNKVWVYLLDPFAFTSERVLVGFFSPEQKKSSLVSMSGWLLINRLLWLMVGMLVLIGTWIRFSFMRFFSVKEIEKKAVDPADAYPENSVDASTVSIGYGSRYNRNVLSSLTRIELTNIFRDNYFRLILLTGICAMVFMSCSNVSRSYGVPYFPGAVRFLPFYNHNFQLFAILVIIFYSGEALHRERSSGFSVINDSLPPASTIFYASKLFSVLLLALLLALIPMLVGVAIELVQGTPHLHFSLYVEYSFGILLPKYVEIMMLAFGIHALINNKFAAHAVGIIIAWLLWLANSGAIANYNLLLYSYTPSIGFSDMDGIGPAIRPLVWFNLYWLFNAGLWVLAGYLLYPRGVTSSFGERLRLAADRLSLKPRLLGVLLLSGFLLTGAYNYYQVSYRSVYLTAGDRIERAIAFERQLKKYEDDPIPSVIKYNLHVDIFPEERRTATRAEFVLVNRTTRPIARMLLDGDHLSTYTIGYNGKSMNYTSPLSYPHARFSIFKRGNDTSMYRVYTLPKPLAPGDTGLLELTSTKEIIGFSNRFSSVDVLRNGTYFDGGLPDPGYDEDEELGNEELRRQYGLPKKEEELPQQGSPEGMNKLLFTHVNGLTQFEATISTSPDQVAIAPGVLEKTWVQNGRNYYHYVLDSPGTYFHFPVLSARYATLRSNVTLPGGKNVGIGIYYHPTHTANLPRFLRACKDGLSYYSKAFGPYQFKELRFLETSVFSSWTSSYPGGICFAEYFGWNASFTSPDQIDYCYFNTAFQLAHQWWMFQVAPGRARGSDNIMSGLSKYSALLLYEKKVGRDNMKPMLNSEMNDYLQNHQYAFGSEKPLADSKQGFVSNIKTGLILYGLKDLIGEDSLNASIKEFRDSFALRNNPPYAESNDLIRFIRKRAPDSLQYYLSDSWEKITVYDNRITAATASPAGRTGLYKVHISVSVAKTYTDSSGHDADADQINDLIDIGIFAAATMDREGRTETNPLYLQKHRLTRGEHSFDIIVKGRPVSAGIDPYNKLIDRRPEDNILAIINRNQ